jgi:galactonate dehydratase
MKVVDCDTLYVDAGWRPWIFIKITTDEGVVGWSECTESFGSPLSIRTAVNDLKPLLIGRDPRPVEKIYWEMYMRTRQSAGGIVQKAIGGLQNALLDLKAKDLGISVSELLGGPIRTEIPLYWSHCVTTRVRSADHAGVAPVRTLADLEAFGDEIRRSGYSAVKTNLLIFGDSAPYNHAPGFVKSGGHPELNLDRRTIASTKEYILALRAAVGNEIDIMLDLNLNFKTEGFIKLARALEEADLHWVEIDTLDPEALAIIKRSIPQPVCSCENLSTSRGYRPFITRHAADVYSIDVTWNGLLESRRIAELADLYEANVTPHNHYSHLATFISAQFCASIPNLRIMETDVDDVAWKHELVTVRPHIVNGSMLLPAAPGWGADIDEAVSAAHPWPPA